MIVPIECEELGRLQPLWLLLHAHHQAVAPELAPYVDDATSWSVRGAFYAALLRHGGRAFVASEGGVDLGYAMAARERAACAGTFAGDPEVVELETLLVRPEARGRGIGAALMDAIDGYAGAAGLRELQVGVLPQNRRAVDLYLRTGYRPFRLILTRFGRPAPVPSSPIGSIEDVAADELDALRPLVVALHRHHRTVAADLGPFVSDDVAWAVARQSLLRATEIGLVLRTGPTARPTGFAAVEIVRDDPLWMDSWLTGRDVAEVTLLAVAEGDRGRGIGSGLLHAVDRRLGELGIADQVAGAIAANAGAIRLFERRGFTPAWLHLRRRPGE